MELQNRYLVKYFIVMFICFTADSTISYFLPVNFSKENIVIIPCLAMMMYILMIKDIEGAYRYLFGAICGLYQSIVYSNSLAIYIVFYVIIAFVRSYIIKIETFSFLEALLFSIITLFLQEFALYGLMQITNVTYMTIMPFLTLRMVPTLVANAILFFGVYAIYNRIKIEEKQ